MVITYKTTSRRNFFFLGTIQVTAAFAIGLICPVLDILREDPSKKLAILEIGCGNRVRGEKSEA